MSCECGNEAPFQECCGRFLGGSASPETAQELMRSRFVAFGLSNFDYIEETQLEPLQQEVRNREAPEWESLQILSCEAGGKEDETGTVEFLAHYRLGERRRHHEVSRFIRKDGAWCYKDGDIDDAAAPESSSTKTGRNDPCPCGSGRKYKRCCGV